MHKNIFICVVLIFLGQISSATIDAMGAVSTATGGGGRGAVEIVDGLYLNPAFLRDFQAQNFSYNYAQDTWALTMTDSGTEAFFPAGIQFISHKTDTLDTQKFGLTLVAPRFGRLALGATTSLVEYSEKSGGVLGDKYRQGVVDLGLTYIVNDHFTFGFVANKVGSSEIKLNESLQLQKSLGLGFGYTLDNFARFRVDVESAPENKTDKLIYMAGLENFINQWVIFRIGFQNNKVLEKDFVTAGVGFAGPQFTLHYAYIADTSDQANQKHLFDLGIPF